MKKENALKFFLDELNQKVFIKSTDSITGEETNLNPVVSAVEDQEATIKISGEWDREDLKQILFRVYSFLK